MSTTPAEVLSGLRRSRYADLLRTLEWREFNQRMFKAKGGRCEVCRAKHGVSTHHNYYEAGRLPWEYTQEEVRLLCGPHHEAFEEALRNFRRFVAPFLTPEQFKMLNGVLLVWFEQRGVEGLLIHLLDGTRSTTTRPNGDQGR